MSRSSQQTASQRKDETMRKSRGKATAALSSMDIEEGVGTNEAGDNGSVQDDNSNPASTDHDEEEEPDVADKVGTVVVRRRARGAASAKEPDPASTTTVRRVSSRSTKFKESFTEPRLDAVREIFAVSKSQKIVARSARNTRKKSSSFDNDDDEDASDEASPAKVRRSSSRSTRFTQSMKEPASDSVRDLFMQVQAPKATKKSATKAEDDDDSEDDYDSESPVKKPQPRRRQEERRRRIPVKKPAPSPKHRTRRRVVESDESVSEESGGEEDDDDDVEKYKIQRIIASRSERRSKWREICSSMNTCEITDGSRWYQDEEKEADENDDIEERFLVKWDQLSYLHVSWETQKDLIEETEKAKNYLSTFFRKSVNGLLFSQDERCDGEYFDPAFTQVERVLDVEFAGKMPKTAESKDECSPSDFGVITDRNDPGYDGGFGRVLTVKWGNMAYSDQSEEYERDLILSEVEYKEQLKKFQQRSKKPTKTEINKRVKDGDEEWRKAFKTFTEGNARKEAEHEQGVQKYQRVLREGVFPNGGQLRDYQAEGIAWMISNRVNNRSSILADEMGLGKTLQTAAYVNRLISTYKKGPALVVVPLSTIAHWQREFESWTDLNTIVYHGSSSDREIIREMEFAYKSDCPARQLGANQLYLKQCAKLSGSANPNWMVQVVITTPEILVAEDWKQLTPVKWEVLVVDEAHRLKNHNSKLALNLRTDTFSFGHKILLTGTPIQNDVKEFWTLLNFIDPKEYDDLDDFMENYGDMKSKEKIDDLHEKIRPYILRRLKEDVEKSVPPKEETLIEVELTILQKQYYRALYEKNVAFLHKNKKKALDGPSLNNLAMQLRKCCNHLFLLNGVEEEARKDQMKDGSLSEAEFLVRGSGKLVLLDKLLPRLQEKGHRVLVFSQFKIMLDILEDYLSLRRMKFERIDGSITGHKRQQAIDRFQKPETQDPPFIMLLSTRAGGVGINLTAADTCIIFDSDWNPQNDLQAQARCHRIGQTKDVKVYRLLSRKSYEMQMFHMSSLKMGLDQAVLKGFESGATGEASMTKEEVERLLRHGAYDIFNEIKTGAAEQESNAFVEQDIDSILERRSRTLVHKNTGSHSDAAGGTFSKASFKASSTPGASEDQAADDIDIEDPDFWTKMVGAAPVEEIADLGTRKRKHANYSERNYERRLEASILGNNDSPNARIDVDTSDYSSSEDESSSDDESGPISERSHWGGAKKNQWKREQAESVLKTLETHGYGSLTWDDFFDKFPKWKHIEETEVNRMCWSLLLLALYEGAKEDASNAQKRAERAAEKKREQGEEWLGEVLVETQPDESLREAAFRKLWNTNLSWVQLVLKDAVSFAQANKPRLLDMLDQSKHEDKISTLFYSAVWPSLKSRGWKEEAVSHGKHFTYHEHRFASPRELLNSVPKIHPELTNMVIPVLQNIEASHQRDAAREEEDRSQHLALTTANVDAATLHKFLQKYAPLQLLVDRRSSRRLNLGRKIFSACTCMKAATTLVQRSSEDSSNEDSLKRLGELLLSDARSAVPHPLWTQTHDAILIQAIAKHGWIDREKSCRAITADPDIKWGPPFDYKKDAPTCQAPHEAEGGDEKELGFLRHTASRASKFLSNHHGILEDMKACNLNLLVETYCLQQTSVERGEDESSPVRWAMDEDLLLRSLSEVQKGNGSTSPEPLDLPAKRDLARRAKAVLLKSIAGLDDNASTRQNSAAKVEEPSFDYGYPVISQTNRCFILLAEMLRGIVKASPAKLAKQLRLLCSIAYEESLALKEMFESSDDEKHNVYTMEMQRVAEQIVLVKKCLVSATRPAKNVARVMLGLEPVAPRSAGESLFPSKAILEQFRKAPPKEEQRKIDSARSRDDGALGERSLVRAMKRAYETSDGKPCKFSKKTDPESDSGLQLTMVESLILFTFCSEGIPVSPESKKDLDSFRQDASQKYGLSWEDIGHLLEAAAKDYHHVALDKLTKSRAALKKLESQDDSSAAKQQALKKLEFAEFDEDVKDTAAKQASDYAAAPEKLAKKSIMLVEKVRQCAGQFSTTSKAGHKLENGLGIKVPIWFGKELDKWAQEFDLVDASGLTLAISTKDILAQSPAFDNTTCAAFLDKKSCRQICCQVALLARLRSLLLKNGEQQARSKVVHAVRSIVKLEDEWEKRPSWWVDEGDESPTGHNLLLLQRLSEHGFLNVLSDASGFGSGEAGQDDEKSLRDLSLTKALIQLRANQLVRELHALEESEETMRMLKERRNRAVAKRENFDRSLSEINSGKSTSRGGIQTGLHAFFASAKSGAKKGSVVVLSDSEDAVTYKKKSRSKGKRKGDDSDGSNSPSEKKSHKNQGNVKSPRQGKRKDSSGTRSPSRSPEKKLRGLADDSDSDSDVALISLKRAGLKG